MNKLLKYLAGGLIVVGLCSCQDRLNYNEDSSYGSEQIFSSFERTKDFVSNIYSQLENGLNDGYDRGALLASACDEAEFAWSNSNIHQFYNGAWSKTNPLSSTWTDMYKVIRAVNLYLKESEGQTFESYKNNEDYSEQMERFNRYKYEVRFLRAFFYFELVRTYGDVPLVTSLLSEDEVNTLKRTPKQDVFRFIFNECDDILASGELPDNYNKVAYKETGRITGLAVLSLKARAAMYAASPLFGESTAAQWKYALDANKAVILKSQQMGKFLGEYQRITQADNYNGPEMILSTRLGDINYFETNNFPVGVEGGNSGNCPSQTLVDAYRMKATGKFIDEPGSGYNPEKPYEGRDPRFELTIAHNGTPKWPAYNTVPLQTYEGGINGYPTPGATPSGYYLKKYCDQSVDLRPNHINTKRHSWVIFRLGEFYLNYAECIFRYKGNPDAKDAEYPLSAVDAMNVVQNRKSLGMPKLPYGMSNELFWRYYENERMVELAFEQHRFWDLRRWKQGQKLSSVKLMRLSLDESTGKIIYHPFVKERQWFDKMYFFPIPEKEILKNTNLKQNPGW